MASRVGKLPVVLPKNVEVIVSSQKLQIKGPRGSMTRYVNSRVKVITEADATNIDSKVIKFEAVDDSAESNALTGTERALVSNMVHGVSEGFEKSLELVGVGYRAQIQGRVINLNLGFSHPIDYCLPEGITAESPKNTLIVIKGASKELVGKVASEIRGFRPPEPYKGKGIRYVGEKIIRKETKKK